MNTSLLYAADVHKAVPVQQFWRLQCSSDHRFVANDVGVEPAICECDQ